MLARRRGWPKGRWRRTLLAGRSAARGKRAGRVTALPTVRSSRRRRRRRRAPTASRPDFLGCDQISAVQDKPSPRGALEVRNSRSDRNAGTLFCTESCQEKTGVSHFLNKNLKYETAVSSFRELISHYHNPYSSRISSDLHFPALAWSTDVDDSNTVESQWGPSTTRILDESFRFEC